jgi:hypothetical protein
MVYHSGRREEIMATTSYATVQDLSVYWRPITESETARANDMLSLASSRLRLYADNSGIDLDAKAAADEDYANALKWVVMEATKRALSTPIDTPPVDSYSQAAGPYSENYKFTNPSGDLWFKKAELKTLGISGVQRATSISPVTRKDIYGE